MGTQGTPQTREKLDELLYQIKNFADVIPCGSYRRGAEICNDLDLAMVTDDGKMPPDIYTEMQAMGFEILERGTRRGRFLKDGQLQVDWYATPEHLLGALLLHLTGSAEFNVGMRGRCKMLEYSFSENGLVSRETRELVAGKTEEEIFFVIGMRFVPPAERTNFLLNYRQYKIK